MDGRNDHLVKLQMRQVFFHHRGAFYQYRRFIYSRFIIYYFGARLTVIAIAKMSRFPSGCQDGAKLAPPSFVT